jgi:hypothetical protein
VKPHGLIPATPFIRQLEGDDICRRCEGEGVITIVGYSVNPFSGVHVADPQGAHDETCPDCLGLGVLGDSA